MSYMHGIYTDEIPTSITPPVTSTAGLTVVFGTAPIHLLDDPAAAVNKAFLSYSFAEAAKQVGYLADFEKYTICEAISSHYLLHQVAPLVMVNVLDPAIHKVAENEVVTIVNGEGILETDGVLKASVVVKSEDGETTHAAETYELEFDDAGKLRIFTEVAEKVKVEFNRLDPSLVNDETIIGGVGVDGQVKGIELINTVFPRFRLVPGILIAPKFSTSPLVAAVLKAKAKNINGIFSALAVVDIPTTVKNYTDVPEYKNTNNLDDPNLIVCWPKVSIGGIQYHMSTQFASLANAIDAQNEGYPFMEPSNNNLQMDAAVLSDGTEVFLGLEQANYLNGQGIVTALNFIGGWKLWGHRTSAYPANTDPKDTFISARRVFIFEENDFILSYWQKVDKPGNRKLIDNVVDSKNIDLNGKAARQFILGGRIEFIQEENPLTELMDGTYIFHLYLTPATPGRELRGRFELDPSYFESLFS